MALTPRPMTYSGLRRLQSNGAPALPSRAVAVQPLPILEGNRGGALTVAAGFLGQAAGDLAAQHRAEQQLALGAALSRSEAVLATELQQTAQRYETDHQGFDAAAGAVADRWAGELPAELQQQARTAAVRQIEQHKRRILDAERAQQRAADKAELLDRLGVESDGVLAAARTGDSEAVTAGLAAFNAAREVLFQGGMLTAGQYVAALGDLTDGVERQGVLRGFDVARGQGLTAAEAYLRRFEGGEEAAQIENPDQRARIIGEMNRDLAHDRAAARIAKAEAARAYRAEFGDIRDSVQVAADAVVKGRHFAGYDQLKDKVAAAAADGDENYQGLLTVLAESERRHDTVKSFARMPLDDQAEEIQRRSAAVSNATDNAILDAMVRVHQRTKAEIGNDPHLWADAQEFPIGGQAYEVQPLILTDPVSMGQSLAARAAASDALQDGLNRPVPLFRPGEAELVRDQLTTGSPEERAAYLETVAHAGGSRSSEILGVLSKEIPQVAHLGGLLMQGPQHRGAVQTALIGNQAEGIQLPPDHRIQFQNIVGAALTENPNARNALLLSAEAHYKGLAAKQGFDKDSSTALDAFEKSIQLMAGATLGTDDEWRGGIGEFNSGTTFMPDKIGVVVPAGMTSDELQDFFDSLDRADLINGSRRGVEPSYANGQKFEIDGPDNIYPVASGDGRYLLSTTNPADGNPTYLRGSGHRGRYELDIRQALQDRRAGNVIRQ